MAFTQDAKKPKKKKRTTVINDLSESKWAVMICLSKETDDWIFVTEKTDSCAMWDLQPVLFDDINKAMEFAKGWTLPGKEENVQVVSYYEDGTKRPKE